MPSILPSHFADGEFLSPHEALAKYAAEKIEPQLDRYRLWDHDSFKDFHRRKGQVIHSSRFIHRLRHLVPRLIVQRQVNFPDDWGLYIQRKTRLIYLSAISKGWLTEFSYALVDERDLPANPVWGWRHVLVRSMAKGALDWITVEREFGNSIGANSERWQIYTEPFRNRHATGVVHRNLRDHFD
jgi:hypothetical protein